VNPIETCNSAYIIGVSLGDGNLSRPNGRATRLRITCDTAYPAIAGEISDALKRQFPKNRVSIVREKKATYFNISVYSNKLDTLLPWKVGQGTKHEQGARVPGWITNDRRFSVCCLKGLLQTDGSLYVDRGYTMVNFTNNTLPLAEDVKIMMENLGFKPKLYTTKQNSIYPKHTVRLSKDVKKFVELIEFKKN
jgi:intein/homing endonuclease